MQPAPITSRQNPKIKRARALRQRKERLKTGHFLVEGIRHVGAAVQAGYPLEQVFFAPELLTSDFAQELIERAQSAGAACMAVSQDVFVSMAEKSGPQGVLAVARQRRTALTELRDQNFSWGVALVTPQDPGNIGTILRTIEAVGAHGLVLLEGGADPWHPTAVRAGMGAHFWVPIVQASWSAFAAWAGAGVHLYGSSARGQADFRVVDYIRPCVLLLGSEREGLSGAQRAACDAVVGLPMHGQGSSLNLGVAAGVLLYAMLPASVP